ncbi:hypothetical protein Airi01_004320 [Actinoallomurus iriomotensis]|uniref:Lipoprotein n=2 Tax=Thermomonosporaceae TaxID=2012 RepID=A0A9W6RCE7_9ACTN|nr:hypothetical protein Airi01_004320 [Actinoallomurus iriomotensis]
MMLRTHATRRIGATLCAGLAVQLAGAGCSGGGQAGHGADDDGSGVSAEVPRLVRPGTGASAGMAFPAKRDHAYSAGLGVFCLDAPGSVRIASVGPIATKGGIAVTGFAIRANPADQGGLQIALEPRSLKALGFDPVRPQTVDGTCGAAGTVLGSSRDDSGQRSVELAVQLVRSGDETGRIDGFLLTYLSMGKSEKIKIPMTVILCEENDRTTRQCNHH